MEQKDTIVENTPVAQNFRPGKVKDKHYVMGASTLPTKPLMPGGHGWKSKRPVGETQSKYGIDPESCPAGGTLNAYETLGRHLNIWFQSDLSERALGILMGMSGLGGWPWDAAEKLHKYGAIPEAFLPFDEKITTLQKYFSPRPLSYSLFKIAQHWLTVYETGFEWVVNPQMNLTGAQKKVRMMEALQYSPLGVAGYAWSRHGDNKYYNDGPDIHFFCVDDFSTGNYWDAFDTYDPFGKRLDWNYDPNWVIRYSLTKKKVGGVDAVFKPEEAAECRFEYFKYLLSNFFKKS